MFLRMDQGTIPTKKHETVVNIVDKLCNWLNVLPVTHGYKMQKLAYSKWCVIRFWNTPVCLSSEYLLNNL